MFHFLLGSFKSNDEKILYKQLKFFNFFHQFDHSEFFSLGVRQLPWWADKIFLFLFTFSNKRQNITVLNVSLFAWQFYYSEFFHFPSEFQYLEKKYIKYIEKILKNIYIYFNFPPSLTTASSFRWGCGSSPGGQTRWEGRRRQRRQSTRGTAPSSCAGVAGTTSLWCP